MLAGISVSWYTWLEQGRDIHVSAATLERLAGVLRLDRAETEHLFALSSRPIRRSIPFPPMSAPSGSTSWPGTRRPRTCSSTSASWTVSSATRFA